MPRNAFRLCCCLLLSACGPAATTSSPPPGDLAPPEVLSLEPAEGATDVPRDLTIRIELSEAIAPESAGEDSVVLTDTVSGRAEPLAYGWDPETRTITATPIGLLAPWAGYRLTLTDGIHDLYGNALAPVTRGFRTIDDVPPESPGAPRDTGDWGAAETRFVWDAATDLGSGVVGYHLEVWTDAAAGTPSLIEVGDQLYYGHLDRREPARRTRAAARRRRSQRLVDHTVPVERRGRRGERHRRLSPRGREQRGRGRRLRWGRRRRALL
jgi:hypothetical protein